MRRVTTIVAGPLALRTRRLRAANAGELGNEITTLPWLAARLAGGFVQPAPVDVLLPAVRAALDDGGFSEIASVAGLPGSPRAVVTTLTQVWRADLDIVTLGSGSPRLGDLALLDRRVRERLPLSILAPPDLRDAALARIGHARAVLGEISLDGVLEVDPVWRPLLAALADVLPVQWTAMGEIDRSWFTGRLDIVPSKSPPAITADACADPRAEVVEALRWARQLLARGDVQASDIAVAAATTEPYDEHLLVLARDACLPLHFTHGIPALDSTEGQDCAALADLLLRGPTQARMRRLLRRPVQAGIPDDWAKGLRRGAALSTVPHWRSALASARPFRPSGDSAERALLPLLSLLFQGPAAAVEAGEAVLDPAARRMWRDALCAAPAEALELSLSALRIPDATEAGACVSWGPAEHLASAPRLYVRLLGLTAKGWPRPIIEDPLLPEHVVPQPWPGVANRPEHDLILFDVIQGAASGGLALSRPRRSAEGSALGASRLWLRESNVLGRTRTPQHAYGEADRLLARPRDAAADPHLARARRCWRAWRTIDLTEYDGSLPPNDPAVMLALRRIQSTGSLRRLLRDPLAFILVDALGFRAAEGERQPLFLDPRSFGELAHEILRRSVDALEPEPTLARADDAALRIAVSKAAAIAAEDWPLDRAVPPLVPWRCAVEAAASLALAGLSAGRLAESTRTWTEVAFGAPDEPVPPGLPWDPSRPIEIGGLLVGGRIDRLDVRAARDAAKVTDYKTGDLRGDGDDFGLAAGTELQRVVYAAAVHQGLPDIEDVRSRLLHLCPEPKTYELSGARLAECMGALSAAVAVAAAQLQGGVAPSGPDARERYSRTRLALPAELDTYLARKGEALARAYTPLRPLWEQP